MAMAWGEEGELMSGCCKSDDLSYALHLPFIARGEELHLLRDIFGSNNPGAPDEVLGMIWSTWRAFRKPLVCADHVSCGHREGSRVIEDQPPPLTLALQQARRFIAQSDSTLGLTSGEDPDILFLAMVVIMTPIS